MNSTIQRWFFFNDHKKDHVKALDGLRGVAVIMVLLAHSSSHKMNFHEAVTFVGIGKIGVYLFYVLSAYLLDRQISMALLNQTADSFFWKRYFLRRFLRIYPLFILSLFAFWSLTISGIKTKIESGRDVLEHILLLEGKGVFWSIPVEFKYYLLSPFILLVCHRYLKWDMKKIIIFFVVLIGAVFAFDMLLHFSKISTLKYLLVFLTGTTFAIYHLLVTPPEWVLKWKKGIAISGFIALIFCLFLNPNYLGDWSGIFDGNSGRKVMIFYSALCGIMLFSALYDKGAFKRFLESSWLRFIGVISFSIYLIHMMVIHLMTGFNLGIPDALKIYFFFGATILVSTISFLLIERPLSRIRISKRS